MAKRRKSERKKTGRPRALVDATKRTEVLKVLRACGSRHDAAAKAGVTYNTLLAETKRDSKFQELIVQAESEGKLALILRVNKASSDDWKAAAWMLERKWWKDWSKRNPDTISADQLATAFSRLVAVLLTELPAEFHERVRSRVEEIIASIVGQQRG